MKYYTGIGSRETPPPVRTLMTRVAQRLAELSYILRSGGAGGADIAFELGVGEELRKNIFLPWKGFNQNQSSLFFILPEAYEMAEQFHPNWDACSPAARKFHARNCYQVLGIDLKTPSDFVLCWTPNGKPVGGTGQALRIATHHKIPIVNFFDPNPLDRIAELIA